MQATLTCSQNAYDTKKSNDTCCCSSCLLSSKLQREKNTKSGFSIQWYAIDHPYTEHITIDAQIPFENQILSNEKVWTIKKSCWMRKENRITSYWSRWNCQAVVLIVRPIKINGNWHHTHTRCVQKKTNEKNAIQLYV